MLSDYFPPYGGGGVEKVVFELARTLVRKGLDVGIITLNARGAPETEVLEGIDVRRIRGHSLTAILGLQSAISARVFPDALRICRRFDPDIIHAHNILFMTALVTPWLKRRIHRPLVTTMHIGPLDHLPGVSGAIARHYEALIGRWILRSSDLVLAVSDSVRNHGLRLGVLPHRIVTIPNAVELPSQDYSLPPPRRSSIVFIGRLIVNKGPHFFIRAAARVLASMGDVEFLLVGDGPMRQRLESEVVRRGLQSDIRFLGFREDVPAILGRATIFVRPSLLEGCPLTVLEAMAHGVPVIASLIPGNTDLVRHGETGILTPAGDIKALADAIITLLGDSNSRRYLTTNARMVVGQWPGWDSVGERTISIYERILGSDHVHSGMGNVSH